MKQNNTILNGALLTHIARVEPTQQPVNAQEFDRVLAKAVKQVDCAAQSAQSAPADVQKRSGSAPHGAHAASRKKRPLLRAVRGAAIGAAACCALLLGTNLANPVFAESLPLVGSIFAYFNTLTGKSEPPYLNDEVTDMAADVVAADDASDTDSSSLAANATDSAGHIVMQQPSANITVEQAVCDGMMLQLSLRMKVNDTSLAGAKQIWSLDTYEGVEGTPLYPQYEVRANGKLLMTESPTQWFIPVPDAPGEFMAVLAYRVDALWEDDAFPSTLDVSFLSHGFVCDSLKLDHFVLVEKGYTDRTDSYGKTETMVPGEWQCKFSVPSDTSKTRMICQRETQGEVTLKSTLIGPSSMIITLTLPTEWVHVTLTTPKDNAGNRIDWHTGVTMREANGRTTWAYIGSAPLSGAKSVNFSVYDKNTDETKASYTVALQ
ncbi:MAG: DUF4179 domain-containing protein [Ruthenibacterium sp.]